MPLGYQTPDDVPAQNTCRVLFIPDSAQWIAVVTGALNALALPESWEKYGTLTPDEAAEAFAPLFDEFCFKEGVCRVVGEIIPFAASTSPSDKWLPCDGASLVRADYPDLFAVIGTTYGSVDGTHFNVPDLRGRAPINHGQGTGLTNRAIGAAVGAETHQLTASEMPSHSHTESVPYISVMETPAVPIPAYTSTAVSATGAVGGSGAHNNMQPSLAINYLIVALP